MPLIRHIWVIFISYFGHVKKSWLQIPEYWDICEAQLLRKATCCLGSVSIRRSTPIMLEQHPSESCMGGQLGPATLWQAHLNILQVLHLTTMLSTSSWAWISVWLLDILFNVFLVGQLISTTKYAQHSRQFRLECII